MMGHAELSEEGPSGCVTSPGCGEQGCPRARALWPRGRGVGMLQLSQSEAGRGWAL